LHIGDFVATAPPPTPSTPPEDVLTRQQQEAQKRRMLGISVPKQLDLIVSQNTVAGLLAAAHKNRPSMGVASM